MSGKERFFDKQDQKRLDDDWLTGFDNRDRLAYLAEQIRVTDEQLKPVKQALYAARDEVRELENSAVSLNRLAALQFDDIDLPGAEEQLHLLAAQLETLTRPDSELAIVKAELDEAKVSVTRLEALCGEHLRECTRVRFEASSRCWARSWVRSRWTSLIACPMR
ncbi:hypothetical protein IR012_26300 [Pseudomonas putida]|nr:hypothetical protein [Pseudomonas putida]MBF8672737.1 hypothetical protein [Pseudomonas putida]MBF8715826.1 hypothetical protein [Pseudomonas putida]